MGIRAVDDALGRLTIGDSSWRSRSHCLRIGRGVDRRPPDRLSDRKAVGPDGAVFGTGLDSIPGWEVAESVDPGRSLDIPQPEH
jgi:hypothetical protein